MNARRTFFILFLILYALLFSYFSLSLYRNNLTPDILDALIEFVLAVLMLVLFSLFQFYQGSLKAYSNISLGLAITFVTNVTDVLDEFCDFPTVISYLTDDFPKIISLIFIIFGIKEWINNNRKMIQKLEELATYDGLTQIFNRQSIDSKLSYSISKVRRYPAPLSIILFDIDHFKKINDTYGHSIGDNVLKELAKVTENSLRELDLLGRYGGEEFLIVLQETTVEGAHTVAEKIRKTIENNSFDTAPSVTVSMGIAELRENEIAEHFVQRADMALYIAKDRGRNQAVIAE